MKRIEQMRAAKVKLDEEMRLVRAAKQAERESLRQAWLANKEASVANDDAAKANIASPAPQPFTVW